jgi:hypothetical protein
VAWRSPPRGDLLSMIVGLQITYVGMPAEVLRVTGRWSNNFRDGNGFLVTIYVPHLQRVITHQRIRVTFTGERMVWTDQERSSDGRETED